METYRGHVRSPADAIKLFEACRLGLLPRVQRRLSEKERQSIASGSVFVWDEREAGMRRWTDGKSWSASRVSGSFLTYREMEGKRGGGNFVPAPSRRIAGKTPDSGRGSDEDADMDGEGPDGYRYKPDGLMKQSFSITTSAGQHLHLISYYARPHSNGTDLLQPTLDPALRHIVPVKGMYPESTVHEQAQGPAVTRAPMAGAYMTSAPPMAPGPPPHGRPGYAPYNVPQGYNWPPSPVATPPYNYPPGHYGSQLPPPPPGSGHLNPHQYSPHHHPHAPPTGPPQPHTTAYDRLPPPLSDSSLPPPPPPASGHRHTGSGSYAQNSSPQISQARLIAEQQAQQAQRLTQQAMPAPSLIDPRIMGPTSAPTTAPQTNGHSPSQNSNTSNPSSQPNGQSQNIPSISSLVHSEEVKTPNSSRPGSASPKDSSATSVEGGKPQDIPHAKLGFGGEDMRALRVLDRKFCI